MAAQRFTSEQHRKWAEMREAGASFGRIARKYGCARSTVQVVCLTLGAQAPKPARPVPLTAANATRLSEGLIVRRFTEDEDAQILRGVAEGESFGQIAQRLPGRHRGTVRIRAIRLAMHEALAEAA